MSQTPRELLEKTSLDLDYLLRSSGSEAGAWQSIFKGLGTDVVSLRSYRPGDHFRNIHRPSYARYMRGDGGEVMTKEFTDRRNLNIWIFLDLSPFLVRNGSRVSPYAKQSRESALVFSAIVMSAATFSGIPIGVHCSQLSVMSPGIGAAYFEDILSHIQGIPVQVVSTALSQDSLAWREDAFRGVRNSLVFFVSGFVSDSKELVRIFDSVRITNKVDVVPVYLDPYWVWDTVNGTFEIVGQDASGKLSCITTDTRGKSRIATVAEAHRSRISDVFAGANLPWLHLTEPDVRQIEERMTNCFIEKLRGL